MTVADLVRGFVEVAIVGLLVAGAELRRLALTQAAEHTGRAAAFAIMANSNARFAAPVQSKGAVAESCVWTCGSDMSALYGMAETYELDEETSVLVEQLCTRAGILMEDASVQALIRAALLDDLHLKIERSRFAVRQMDRLLSAADALLSADLGF